MRRNCELSIRLIMAVTILLLCAMSGCSTRKGPASDPRDGLVLTYRMPEGETLRYRTTNDMKQLLKIREQDVNIASRREYLFSLRSRGTEDGNLRLSATIDSFGVDITSPQGAFSPNVSDIAGKSFEILLSPLGRELEMSGLDSLRYDLGQSGKRSISPDFQTLFPDLPDRRVTIGDTWDSEDTIIDDGGGSRIRINLTSVNRLDGFETVMGMKCARVTSDVTGTLEGEGEQRRAKMTFAGDVTATDTWFFAYESGMFVKILSESSTEGSITMSDPQSMRIPMTMEMAFQAELNE